MTIHQAAPGDPSGAEEREAGEPALRALLVGIDRYLEPPAGSPAAPGSLYPDLAGAVADVGEVEGYLRHQLGLPGDRLAVLTASRGRRQDVPPEPEEDWPTYERLVAALRRLEEESAEGDQALVWYCGHGGRTPTVHPDLKGPRAKDECLVPVDAALGPDRRYLRDVEIFGWLRRMQRRRVFVTLVLDCCHSGGAWRTGVRVHARGGRGEDRIPRPADSLLVSREEVEAVTRPPEPRSRPPAAWNGGARTLRHVRLENLPGLRPEGFCLLAACGPRERALERCIEDRFRGVLTHLLVEVLSRGGRELSYRGLHGRLLESLRRTRWSPQTPLLVGEGERRVLGRDQLPGSWGTAVLGEEPGEGWVLQAGRCQGVSPGARFELHPPGALRPAGPPPGAEPLGWLEVTRSEATEARARLCPGPGGRPSPVSSPPPGARAVLVDPGPGSEVYGVRLPDSEGRHGGEMLEELRAWLDGAPGLALTTDHPADFTLILDRGRVRLGDGALGEPLEGVPAVPLEDPAATRRLAAILIHLTRYRRVLELGQPRPAAWLEDGLRLVLETGGGEPAGLLGTRVEEAPRRGRELAGEGTKAPRGSNGLLRLGVGEPVHLWIENLTPRSLHVAVLDLQPDRGIVQVHPRGAPYVVVEARSAERVALRTYLPPGMEAGRDVLKAVATVRAGPRLRCLELPALGETVTGGGDGDAPARRWRGGSGGAGRSDGGPGEAGDPLARLLASRGGAAPEPVRWRSAGGDDAGAWITAEAALEVSRDLPPGPASQDCEEAG